MMNPRHVSHILGMAAGSLLAAAFLPVATAFADDYYGLTPDITTFVTTQVEGYPPLVNIETGTEEWSPTDLSNGTVISYDSDEFSGVDTMTSFGSFTNDDFVETATRGAATIFDTQSTHAFTLLGGFQVDLANFGGGFENEWIDIPAGSTDPGASDLLITPFGDFSLFGSALPDLSVALTEQLAS